MPKYHKESRMLARIDLLKKFHYVGPGILKQKGKGSSMYGRNKQLNELHGISQGILKNPAGIHCRMRGRKRILTSLGRKRLIFVRVLMKPCESLIWQRCSSVDVKLIAATPISLRANPRPWVTATTPSTSPQTTTICLL